MVDMPEGLMDIIRSTTRRYLDDIDKAVESAKRRLVRRPEYDEWKEDLIMTAIRRQIHEVRHRDLVAQRNAAKQYGAATKAPPGDFLNEIAWESSLLTTYYIAGRIIGTIPVAQLDECAAIEQEKANGAQFNADFALGLKRLCKGKKGELVRECTTEEKVREIFTELMEARG